MEKEMEKEKNNMMVNFYMKVYILKVKDGMVRAKNMDIMDI